VRLNVKRFFKIEQASIKLIEIIPVFSGRNFKLDCLNTICTDIYVINRLNGLPSFQFYINCLKQLSGKLF